MATTAYRDVGEDLAAQIRVLVTVHGCRQQAVIRVLGISAGVVNRALHHPEVRIGQPGRPCEERRGMTSSHRIREPVTNVESAWMTSE